MYTGTLISDLMATVERVERRGAAQRLIAEERELERIFELQTPVSRDERIFAGAA